MSNGVTGAAAAAAATARRLSHVDVAMLESPSAEQEQLWRRVSQVRQVLPQCDVVRVLRTLRRVDGSAERATNLLLNESVSHSFVPLAPLTVDESVARTLHSALVSYFRRDRAVAARTIHAAFAGADKQLLLGLLSDVAQYDDDDDVWEAKSQIVSPSTTATTHSNLASTVPSDSAPVAIAASAVGSNDGALLVQLPTPDDSDLRSSSSRSDALDAMLAAQTQEQLRIDDEHRSERLAYELQYGAPPPLNHPAMSPIAHAVAFRRAASTPVPVHTASRPRDAPRLTQSATPTAAHNILAGASPGAAGAATASSLSASPGVIGASPPSSSGSGSKHHHSPSVSNVATAPAPPTPPPQPSTSFPSFSQIAATLRYWTTPDPVEQCCSAAKRGNVQQLLDALRNVDDINCVNRHGFTALMMAASHRARDCMQLLIERGIDVNARGKSKYTPLHWMAYCGYNEELRLLLAAGADLKARDNSRGQTPLHWALRQKHLKTASMLLESGANANACDNAHRTPLHVATGANDTAQVALLLYFGASTRIRDSTGKLPVELLRDRQLTELFRLWEAEDMSAVTEAAKREMCTFTVTGTTMHLQFFFACETCKLGSANGGGVCVACRRRCHHGHTLSTPHLGLFYCDCGAHGERYHCKALVAVAQPVSLLDLDDASAGTSSPAPLSSSRASIPNTDDDDTNAAREAAEEAAAFAEIAARLRPRSLSSPTARPVGSGVDSHSSPQLPTLVNSSGAIQTAPAQHSDRSASTARADAVSIMSPLDDVPPPIASPRASSPSLQPVLIGFLSASNEALSDVGDDSGGGELSGKQIDLRAWLESLDLLFLERMFRRQRTDIDTVRYLGKEDLVELGVVGLGPLKKLLVEIERLRLHGVKTPHCELAPMAPPLSPPLSPTVAVRGTVHRRSPSGGELPSHNRGGAMSGGDGGDASFATLMHNGDAAVSAPGGDEAGSVRRPLSAQRHFLSDIRKTRPIGEGAFGQVFEGVWQGTTQVAMKRLSDATHARAFEKEAMLLRDLRHPNVVMFLGLFHDDRGEMWIVTEFLSHGSLRHMLQRVGARVTSSALLLMAKDAAAGMKYLSQNHILHRDLAARNLLVKGEDKRFVVKVADFGLSRVTDGTYYSRSRKFPIKWTAPEALQFARFCVPAVDHQLLTNRGFMFLDQVLEHVEYDERAHAVRDWRGLQLAGYDKARGTLVYEQPEALVVNAPSDVPDLVQFTHATEACRWTNAALARAGAPDLVERELSGVSVVVTPNHQMFVRNDDDQFQKVSAGELLRSRVDSIRLLARAEAGFAGANKVGSPPLLELYGFWCGTGSREGNGHVRFEAADVSFAEVQLRLLGVASSSHTDDRGRSTLVVVKEPRIVELFVRVAGRFAPWVWQLERDGARSVLTGLRAAADGMATASVEFRDELVRLALHAGYAAHFVQQRAMWCVRVCDDREPVLRSSVDAVGKVGGAELAQRYAGDATWCATMPSGFIVTRRAHRDAVTGAVVRASQPTIQGNSTKSDVWSFGVVLWEMFEFGKVPYPGMSNRDAMQYVLTGSRLPKPDACPAELYRVMLDCWRADSQQRPSFQQIYDALVQALLRDTRPTVFALNVANGNVRAEPTSAVEVRNDDEAYYADEFGVQISRPVRAEVTNELGYVESPTVDARPDGAALNRHASDAFRSYAFAAMYRDGDGNSSQQQQSYESESGDATTTGASSSMFGLSTGMPSIFTIDPSLLTTRELTNKMDVPDRDTASTSNGPLIDFIRDDDDDDEADDNNTNGDYGSDIYDNYGQ